MANTFIDTARILVRSGAGATARWPFTERNTWRRGGPDGGDGGRGADVIPEEIPDVPP